MPAGMFHIESRRDDGTWVRLTVRPYRKDQISDALDRAVAMGRTVFGDGFDESRLRVAPIMPEHERAELLDSYGPSGCRELLDALVSGLSPQELDGALSGPDPAGALLRAVTGGGGRHGDDAGT